MTAAANYLLVLARSNDSSWDELLAALISGLKRRGRLLGILDTTNIGFLPPGATPRRLSNRNSAGTSIEGCDPSTVVTPSRRVSNALGQGLRISSDLETALQSAAESAAHSLLMDQELQGVFGRYAIRKFRQVGLRTYCETSEFLKSTSEPVTLVVPNGRFPDQALAAFAGLEHGVQVLFYERGSVPGRIFLQEFPTQARFQKVDYLRQNSERGCVEACSECPEEFSRRLSEKLPASKQFSRTWSSGNVRGELELACFTSSQDEFWALGKEWHSNFTDQKQGFREYISSFLGANPNARVCLRMHPNTVNKSLRYHLRDWKWALSLMHSRLGSIDIVGPTSKVNSYELIERSSHTLIWNSSIGLEALFLGRSVTQLAPSELELWFSKETSADRFGGLRFERLSRADILRYVSARCATDDQDLSYEPRPITLRDRLSTQISHSFPMGVFLEIRARALSLTNFFISRVLESYVTLWGRTRR